MIWRSRDSSGADPRTAIADHYDALDPFYRSVWGEHVHHGLWTDMAIMKKLLARDFRNRIVTLTILRLWLAYRTGGMRYGIVWGSK